MTCAMCWGYLLDLVAAIVGRGSRGRRPRLQQIATDAVVREGL